MINFRKKISMRLFPNTFDMNSEEKENTPSLEAPWQSVDVISSNCPIHIGARLLHMEDNKYQCPIGKEIYKAKGNIY